MAGVHCPIPRYLSQTPGGGQARHDTGRRPIALLTRQEFQPRLELLCSLTTGKLGGTLCSPGLGWGPVARPSGGRAQRCNGNSCLLCSGAPLFLKLSGLRGLNQVWLHRASSPSTRQDLSHFKEFQRTLLILMLGYSSRSLSHWEVCTVV